MRVAMQVAALAATVAVGAYTARAEDLPIFERDGLPMTLHQAQTLGPDGVREVTPQASLTWGGMPASPHQVSVLRPRRSDVRE